MTKTLLRFAAGLLAVLPAFAASSAAGEPRASDDPAYVKTLQPGVKAIPLLTVGEAVPRTSNPKESFRLVGVPDGLGLHKDAGGTVRLWVGHELKKSDASQPVPGGPLVRGALVSIFRLSAAPIGVLSGDLAATTYFLDGKPWSPSPALFCSGFLADEAVGLDRPVYLTGEEATGADSGDGRGGLGFAFAAGNAYALPGLGRYRKENLVVVPGTGLKTVLFGLEDGPKGLESELYLYIGKKDLTASGVLERNGLTGGRLYVFATATGGKNDESVYVKTDKPLVGRWLPVEDAEGMTDQALDAKLSDEGAFRFDRIEDGTYDRMRNGVFYFVTTGGDIAQNRKGRLYKLTFNPKDPLAGPTLLEVVLDGGDGIVSPDNIDMNDRGEMLILEDFTVRNFWELFKRNPSIWLYRPERGGPPVRIAEVDGKFWEPSGVVDASAVYGPGAWLLDVQAHTVSSREASERQGLTGDAQLVEGGQILLLQAR